MFEVSCESKDQGELKGEARGEGELFFPLQLLTLEFRSSAEREPIEAIIVCQSQSSFDTESSIFENRII